ncbi:MAG: hypothetical protein ACR2HN_07010 [Tepidiformaceae bacterium]
MSWLGKLKNRGETEELEPVRCPHVTLIPGWDRAEDIGTEAKATRFRCEGCGEEFTSIQAEALRRTEGERLRETMAAPQN